MQRGPRSSVIGGLFFFGGRYVKHEKGSFPTIRLSRIAHNAMKALEDAAMDTEAAPNGAELREAYERFSAAREKLALHIQHLEDIARQQGALGINGTITVRYR